MYYKDDFYKEFRTEKELCEYLEEIDSRAEWIRITSKKLKVAAAGEETCTEVPGISLEALEKDTLSHSRLVLILPERICYIGNSAIKSLKGRARIDGKALADVDKKTLAEILNKCLKVARGRALIRFCEGKIRAVLSGDEKDYAIISIVSSKGKVLLAKDTLIELKTTDEEGKIQFVADLPVDSRYYIKELAAPDGYVTDQEPQEFTFEYQGSGTSVAEYAFTFEDEQTTVELSKADLTDKKELPGASLKVTDEDGNTVDEWVSKEEAHIIKGLIVGKKYKMTETKPADGYVTAESIEFTVENTKEVQKHQMLDDVTKVEISKKDITDSSEVPGAKLIILDKDGKKVESWTSTDKPHMVEKLPVGEYTLREEQAPDGYLIAEDVKFTVKDTGKIQKVKMKDAHPYGKLVIKKTDSTSKAALPGAEFELREKESGKVVEKLVTDKTGTATSGKIPIATYKNGKVEKTVEYILVETKAPNGYELSSKKEEIRFEYKDGKTKVIEIVKEIKNTKSPSGSTPTGNSPKTGDSTNIWLPILLAVLSACGIGGVIWYKKKKGN